MAQKVQDEDLILDALRALGGEASSDAIAEQAGVGPVSALVTCGKLRGTKVEQVEERSRKGNPTWRLVDPERRGW